MSSYTRNSLLFAGAVGIIEAAIVHVHLPWYLTLVLAMYTFCMALMVAGSRGFVGE